MSSPLPNVIWIFGDQHRAQALGHAGDPNVNTPNLDRFATESLRFSNAFANSPLCCPARGNLLTGRYCHEAVNGHEVQLDPKIETIANAFTPHGYHTAWFGKWHLDGFKERESRAAFHQIPKERRGGFDTWLAYENNNSAFDCWLHGHKDAAEITLHRLKGYETDALTDLFIEHLEQRATSEEQPFFAALSVQPPHNPYVAPERWMAGKSRAKIQFRQNVPNVESIRLRASTELVGYYAAIECLDWNFGRILEALERLHLFDNTHILFFSDHGDMHGSQGQFLKTSPFDESLRVPLLIGGIDRAYGIRRGNQKALFTHVDLAPTSLGLCGLPVPTGMRGKDLSGLRLTHKPAPELPDSAFLQMVIPTRHEDSPDRAWRGIVSADGWKYACFEGGIPWLLFNMNEDPYEQANLALNSRYRVQRNALHDRLERWIKETGDCFAMACVG